MKNLFEDKVAIVTGAASGLGRALVVELALRGAVVVCGDKNHDGLKDSEKLIKHSNGRVHINELDVTKPKEVESLINSSIKEHGRLDYIFNNAGVVIGGEARDLELEHWFHHIDVNLMGVVYGTFYAYRQMVKQGYGHIVNTASVAGLVAVPTIVPYTMTKHGVVGLSKSLRAEGKKLGVKVSVVCPGFVRTGMFQMNVVNVDIERHEENVKEVPEILIWDPTRAAYAILKSVAKNRSIIVFPFYARISYWFNRLNPALLNHMHQMMIKSLREIRLGTNEKDNLKS